MARVVRLQGRPRMNGAEHNGRIVPRKPQCSCRDVCAAGVLGKNTSKSAVSLEQRTLPIS